MKGKIFVTPILVILALVLSVLAYPVVAPTSKCLVAQADGYVAPDLIYHEGTSPGTQQLTGSWSYYGWLAGTSVPDGDYLITFSTHAFIDAGEDVQVRLMLADGYGLPYSQYGAGLLVQAGDDAGSNGATTTSRQWVVTLSGDDCHYIAFQFKGSGKVVSGPATMFTVMPVDAGGAPWCR